MTPRVPFQLGECLGGGGEARVFAVKSDAGSIAKLYHSPTRERAEKLAVMIEHPPAETSVNGHTVIAWPTKRIFAPTDARRVLGCVMPRVPAGVPVAHLHNMRSRLATNPHFHWKYLVRTAMNTALTFQKVHDSGYVIGDVNDQGVLVAPSALVALVDCDSFQVEDPKTGRVFRCPVGMGPFTPPELAGCSFANVDRTHNHDLFGLAVIVYQLLMGCHPFQVKTVDAAAGPRTPARPPLRVPVMPVVPPTPPIALTPLTIEDCIRDGLYPDVAPGIAPSPVSPPLEVLPPSTRALFRIAFGSPGSRRPNAAAWAAELSTIERDMRRCARNVSHLYAGHLAVCPWCERTAWLRGRDPFPSPDAISTGAHLPSPALRRRVWAAPKIRVPRVDQVRKVPGT